TWGLAILTSGLFGYSWSAVPRPGVAGCTALLIPERLVDLEQRLLLALGDPRVGPDRGLDVGFGRFVEDPGPDVQRLGRDLQALGDALEDLRGRLAQTPLDLAEVRVRDAGELAQLAQRQP